MIHSFCVFAMLAIRESRARPRSHACTTCHIFPYTSCCKSTGSYSHDAAFDPDHDDMLNGKECEVRLQAVCWLQVYVCFASAGSNVLPTANICWGAFPRRPPDVQGPPLSEGGGDICRVWCGAPETTKPRLPPMFPQVVSDVLENF